MNQKIAQEGDDLDFSSEMVRMKGLEPSRSKAHAPKACVSTNSTTSAYCNVLHSLWSSRTLCLVYHSFAGLRVKLFPVWRAYAKIEPKNISNEKGDV